MAGVALAKDSSAERVVHRDLRSDVPRRRGEDVLLAVDAVVGVDVIVGIEHLQAARIAVYTDVERSVCVRLTSKTSRLVCLA